MDPFARHFRKRHQHKGPINHSWMWNRQTLILYNLRVSQKGQWSNQVRMVAMVKDFYLRDDHIELGSCARCFLFCNLLFEKCERVVEGCVQR